MRRLVARFEDRSFDTLSLLLNDFLHIAIKIFSFPFENQWHPPGYSETFGYAAVSCQTDELVTVRAYQNAIVMSRQLQDCFRKA